VSDDPSKSAAKSGPLGLLGAAWGVGGLVVLLTRSIWKLTPMALEPLDMDLAWWHWLAYVGSVVFMAYSEGYKGFQKGFSPRVVARGVHLMRNPSVLRVLFAPAFCMGLFHATRKRQIVAWSVLIGVAGLVVLIRNVDQPWRGIIDAGVVVGLSWGTLAILAFAWRALKGGTLTVDPDVPGGGDPADSESTSSAAAGGDVPSPAA
jgi:hypothetical protein